MLDSRPVSRARPGRAGCGVGRLSTLSTVEASKNWYKSKNGPPSFFHLHLKDKGCFCNLFSRALGSKGISEIFSANLN